MEQEAEGVDVVMSKEEAKDRIKRILSQDEFTPVQDEFGRIPLYVLLGGASVYFLADMALRKNVLGTVTRPGLYRYGGLAVGAFFGLQTGFFRVRSIYKTVDPEGKQRRELEHLFRISRGMKSCPTSKNDIQ